ncbi:hypothetical protein ACOSQ3_006681 [Xanthoceras sorbifolium]
MSRKFSIPDPNEAKRQTMERKAKGKNKANQSEESHVLADEAITPPPGTNGLRRVAPSTANGRICKRGAVVRPCRPPAAFDTGTAACGILPSSAPSLPIYACSLTN